MLVKKTSNNQTLRIDKCHAKECYDLSKLDVSQITNMENLFTSSLFNRDISNWNTSNVTNMRCMFYNAEIFNQPINFNTSKVIYMSAMFSYAKAFNQTINFDILNVEDMELMFNNATAFTDIYSTNRIGLHKNKYNEGESFPLDTKEIKKWFNINRDKMNEIDIKDQHGVELNNFFSNIKLNIIEKTKNNL